MGNLWRSGTNSEATRIKGLCQRVQAIKKTPSAFPGVISQGDNPRSDNDVLMALVTVLPSPQRKHFSPPAENLKKKNSEHMEIKCTIIVSGIFSLALELGNRLQTGGGGRAKR